MEIFNKLVDALRAAQNDDIQLTLTGKAGQGNLTARVHYKRDNLLTKILYRHDLSRLGPNSEELAMYCAGLERPQQHMWTKIPGRQMVELARVTGSLGVNPDMYLPACCDIGGLVLKGYDEFPHTSAYLRQWSAKGKGIGLELIVLYRSEAEVHVFESSINYYIQPDMDKLVASLKKIHEAGALKVG
ncbi:hypothetical protein PA10_00275 [Pseudomonas phage pPa_SNUABM_DT01]|nr:hypothetical protein PA10_00275 [Pseudomonas phage pPa_SNUABM_DT01]